jgi:regulator of protease activity HflC (stomatin/prohibitin superfamily)
MAAPRPGGIEDEMTIAYASALAAIAGAGILWLVVANVRVVKQYERGVVYRFGRVQSLVCEPGLTFLIPIAAAQRGRPVS